MGGSSGGGGGGQTTVQKADPWSGQQPYLSRGFADAQKLFLDSPPPSYYPNSTVQPYSPETNTSLQLRTLRALSGSPVQDAANNQLTNTLNGSYLSGGQGFNDAVDAASRKILPQVDSAFERAGRTGSGLASTARTQAISDSFADQYGQERQNQMRGLLTAPSIQAGDYADIDQLGNVGQQLEGYQGGLLNDQINRYNYGQNISQDQLKQYMNLIQGNYGGTTTTTAPALTKNTGLGMLGGAIGGASLASQLGAGTAGAAGLAGGWGLGAGAAAGLLLGGWG